MNLELKKKELELKKVETAKAELEFKILEKLADIERIKDQILQQDSTIEMLKSTIEAIQEK